MLTPEHIDETFDFGKPWGNRESISSHLRKHVMPGIQGLMSGGEGVWKRHFPKRAAADLPSRLEAALRALLSAPSDETTASLHEVVAEAQTGDLDGLSTNLSHANSSEPEAFGMVGRWLIRDAPTRQDVKLGLTLLALAPAALERDLDVILLLARHSEFTFHAVNALIRTGGASEAVLLEIGKNVLGWGRIEVIERLKGSKSPAVQHWLLRDGSKTGVLDNYIACICTETGRLARALESKEIDADLFRGAGRIIEALLEGGPARDISFYSDGVAAVRLYLEEAGRRPVDLRAYGVLETILNFTSPERTWRETRRHGDRRPQDERLLAHGWTDEVFGLMHAWCQELLKKPEWAEAVQRALGSDDEVELGLAIWFARGVGVDAYPKWKTLLESDPNAWFRISRVALSEYRAQELAEIGERTLLPYILRNPAAKRPEGPLYGVHNSHGYLVEVLAAYPAIGWPVLEAGLFSPLIRVRRNAILALKKWEAGALPPQALDSLHNALQEEPEASLRTDLEELLNFPA